jgi:hypothetical protein
MVLLASTYDRSKYLKAADLERERKLRIKSVTQEEVGVGAEKEQKLVVRFTNDDRGFVLNRVNNRALRGAFGDDTALWAGKVIIIFSMMVAMRGEMVPGLRVRIPPPKQDGNGQTAKPKAPIPKPPVVVDDELDNDEPPAKQPSLADDLDDESGF